MSKKIKKNFFKIVLEVLFENAYLFCALFFTWAALKHVGEIPAVSNMISGLIMFFIWIADRIKIERHELADNITGEIQSRVEAETNRFKTEILAELRKPRE